MIKLSNLEKGSEFCWLWMLYVIIYIYVRTTLMSTVNNKILKVKTLESETRQIQQRKKD